MVLCIASCRKSITSKEVIDAGLSTGFGINLLDDYRAVEAATAVTRR